MWLCLFSLLQKEVTAMTVEEKKIILKDYKNIADRVDSLNRQLARWRSVAYSLSSPMGACARGGDNYRLENVIDRISEIELELDGKAKELIECEHRIKNAIAKMKNKTLRDIITIRYIDGERNWDIIGDRICYSKRHAIRLHGAALRSIDLRSPSKKQ